MRKLQQTKRQHTTFIPLRFVLSYPFCSIKKAFLFFSTLLYLCSIVHFLHLLHVHLKKTFPHFSKATPFISSCILLLLLQFENRTVQ